jgi:alanine racemase
MNARQLRLFRELTEGVGARRSLAATGGILLGPEYHFDIVRPGVGVYGGLPFAEARPVVRLSLPVVQVRDVEPGEAVGYGGSWAASAPARIATLQGGYADGLIRAMGSAGRGKVWAGDVACPIVGRVSMDLITVDVTHLDEVPGWLDMLGPQQTVDDLADAAGTIGYEILTSLGRRYDRRFVGG